jgi:2',3'-cyclic-nucleotide 2'-phosphodiesterase (5'-nucleotidase family)
MTRGRIGGLTILLFLLVLGCKEREQEAPPAAEAKPAAVESKAEAADGAPGDRQPFTLLATGDVRGEIEPCGCEPPTGGLARRVAHVQKIRAAGPVLVVDAGDALAESVRKADPDRARLILDAMAATGVAAATVGETDLAFGVDWLKKAAAETGVPYLAANLVDVAGEPVFPGRKVVEVGGNRIGLFAVLTSGRNLPEGLSVRDAVEAASAEVAALRNEGVDLVVGLVHGPVHEVDRVARGSGADVIVPAHMGGNTEVYQTHGGTWVTYTGHEGRTLLSARFDLRGEGKLVAENVLERLASRRRELEAKIAAGKQQLATLADPAMREEVRGLVERFERELEVVGEDEAQLGTPGRRFRSRFVHLDGKDGEDPAFLEDVRKLANR